MRKYLFTVILLGSLLSVSAAHAGSAAVKIDFDPAVGTTMLATFSYTATAADAGDTLRLICKGVPDATWGGKIGLDDVSVRVPIPPPGSVFVLR